MSLPKLSTMALVLLLANLLMVAAASVDPSDPADTIDGGGHLHLKGDGSDEITLAMPGDNQDGAEEDNHDGSGRRATSTINDVIGDSVGAARESGGSYLSKRHVALITNYETMCCAVLIARQSGGAWDSKEAIKLRSIALFSEEDVLKELGFIMVPNDCSVPITLDRNSM